MDIKIKIKNVLSNYNPFLQSVIEIECGRNW